MAAETPSESDRELVLAAGGGGLKVVGSILRALGGLGVSILLTRLTGAAVFGQYYVCLTAAELIAQVSGLGLQASTLRFIPISIQQSDRPWLIGLVRAAVLIPLFLGLALATLVFGFSDRLATEFFSDPSMAPALRIFAVAIPLSAFANALEAALRGFNRVDLSILGMDFGFQLPKLLFVGAAVGIGYGAEGAATGHVAALFIACLVLAYLLRTQMPRGETSPAVYRLREMWMQSLPVYMTRLLRTFGGRMELLILGFFGLTLDVGIYAAALQISMLGALLPESLITASMPLISGAHHREGPSAVQPLLRSTTRWCMSVVLPYYLVVALFSEELLAIFGEEFVGGEVSLLLLGALPLMNAMAGISASVLTMTGQARINAFNSLVYLVTTIGLDVILIPRYGMVGAASAAFSSTLLLNLLRIAQVRWFFGLWPVDRHIIKPTVATASSLIVALLLSPLLSGLHPWIAMGLSLVAMGLAYLAALYKLGATDEDRVVIDAIAARVPALGRLIPDGPNGSN